MPLRQPGEHSGWSVADGWSSDGGDPSSAASCGHCLVKVCVALQFTTCVFITVSSFSHLSYLVEYHVSNVKKNSHRLKNLPKLLPREYLPKARLWSGSLRSRNCSVTKLGEGIQEKVLPCKSVNSC